MTDLNHATIWEGIAAAVPAADAIAHGDTVLSWADFEHCAARFAGGLAAHGVGHNDKLALYLYNEPAYLIAQFGAMKQRVIPCNVNYRYLAAELRYLLDNADASVVVVDHSLLDRVIDVAPDCADLRLAVVVGAPPDAEIPESAGGAAIVQWDAFLDAHEPAAPIERSGEDLWFLYTGGTTGHPKAVMWPLESIIATMGAVYGGLKRDVPTTVAEAVAIAVDLHDRSRVTRMLAGAPLMHGTSGLGAMTTFTTGGMVATLPGRSFDAAELFAAVEQHRLTQLTIVGDAFCKPMLDELDRASAADSPWDLSTLFQVISSGVVWSAESKAALLEYRALALVDSLGSSEGVGFASNVTRRGSDAKAQRTARFVLGPNSQVFTDDGEVVEPGSGVVGRLAVRGSIPVGYYKAPEKTEETFPMIGGQRWSVPGDYATVETDGTIQLLGRGSVSINSGGEKIYPEEVEEALKQHPAVRDANAVGLPDDKWGQAVCGVIELTPGVDATDEEIIAHAKTVIASYKAPKRLVRVPAIQRGPNGKPDYRWAREVAEAATSG